MRILWHSVAPWAPSGYGTQTSVFAPRIRDLGHDVAISAYWGLAGGMLNWDGMDVYPSDCEFGNRLATTYAIMHDADLVVTLMDVWVLKPDAWKALPNLACWVPVDHEPLKHRTAEFLEKSGARPIAMSRFGERMLQDAGFDPLYVPHGIDTSVYRPRPELRDATRSRMGVPHDCFLVGMVAANKGRNPCRKAFPEMFQAFAEFQRERPDAHLYVHTDPTSSDEGIPLVRLLQRCGIPEDAVSFTKPPAIDIGLPPDQMAAMYGAFDVLANPAYGEGFGIPIVEAQACGTPVIVTDFSAMPELCGAGWKVKTDPLYDGYHGSFFGRPRVTGDGSIVEMLHEAYEARGDQLLRKQARAFALQYDADGVAEEHWRPTLARLAPSRLVLPGRAAA